MKEDDIRADALLVEARRLGKIDHERMGSKRDQFVEVACPACGRDEKEYLYERRGYTFVACRSCETMFVSPRPHQELVYDRYLTSLAEKFWNENVYPQSEKARVEHIIMPRVKRILDLCDRYGVPFGCFMDIGAGCGTFCDQIRLTGKFDRVIAIEPGPSPARSCRERGLPVIEDFFENAEGYSGHIHVATSIECIEHVFDPEKYVRKVYEILSPGGIFIITTPNIKGFDIMVLQDTSDSTVAPDHINFFHPKSIRLLLHHCGFEVLEVTTPGKLDAELVRKKALQGAVSLEDQPFLKHILIHEWETYRESFQTWLADNGLSSHMWVAARKN